MESNGDFDFLNRAPLNFNFPNLRTEDEDSEQEYLDEEDSDLEEEPYNFDLEEEEQYPSYVPRPKLILNPSLLNTDLSSYLSSLSLSDNPSPPSSEIFHTISGPQRLSSNTRSVAKRNKSTISRIDSPSETDQREPEKKSRIDVSNVDFELSGSPKLCETILGHFQYSDLAAFSSKRIYTLSESYGEKGECLVYDGKSFMLAGSQTWDRIEEDFLEKNRENIVNFQKESLDNLSSRYESLRNRALALKSSLDSFSIERFISGYLLPSFNQMSEHKQDSINIPESVDVNPGDLSQLKLNGKHTLMEQLLIQLEKDKRKKIGGMVVFCGGAYTFSPKGYFERDLAVNFADLSYLCQISDLDKQYNRCFSDKIKELTRQSFSRQISSLGNLQKKISSISEKNSPIVKKIGNFSFKKEDECNYTVYLHVPRFVMKINGSYYPFQQTRVQTTITSCNGQISFAIPAVVEDCGYNHPFVFSEGGICYGALKNIKKALNIRKTGYKVAELDKKEFARGVFETLKLAENSLKYGYKKPTYPVHPINSFSTVSYSQASQYGEICDNDIRTI